MNLAGLRDVEIASRYEKSRGAHVFNVDFQCNDIISEFLIFMGLCTPRKSSADLISVREEETRFIEVKAKGNYPLIRIPERQLETFHAAGEHAWLYIVRGTISEAPIELWVTQNPARLRWKRMTPQRDKWQLVLPTDTMDPDEALASFAKRIELSHVELPSKTEIPLRWQIMNTQQSESLSPISGELRPTWFAVYEWMSLHSERQKMGSIVWNSSEAYPSSGRLWGFLTDKHMAPRPPIV